MKVVFILKKLNKLILPADTRFAIDFINLYTYTHMLTRSCTPKWSGKDHLCVTWRKKDARCQVSGLLPDVTNMFLDRYFVPFRIQQWLLSCRALLISSSVNLRSYCHPCLFSSWDKDDRSGGCDCHSFGVVFISNTGTSSLCFFWC